MCIVSIRQILSIQELSNIHHGLVQAAEVLPLRVPVPFLAVYFGVINLDLFGLLSDTVIPGSCQLLTPDRMI